MKIAFADDFGHFETSGKPVDLAYSPQKEEVLPSNIIYSPDFVHAKGLKSSATSKPLLKAIQTSEMAQFLIQGMGQTQEIFLTEDRRLS